MQELFHLFAGQPGSETHGSGGNTQFTQYPGGIGRLTTHTPHVLCDLYGLIPDKMSDNDGPVDGGIGGN
jgi:hypothetical protein